MTEVNYAEVKYITLRGSGEAGWLDAERALRSLKIRFHPANRALSELAAEFKAWHAMSLADAYAAALAKQLGAAVLTGDPEFKSVEGEIAIHWLPNPRRA